MTMDEILSLVRSGGNEERIAGLMLCIKHLHLSNLPPSSLNPAQMDKLKKVITGVEPAFLVRMLRSQSLRPISLVLMNHILACPALVEDISSHVVHIYEAILLAEKANDKIQLLKILNAIGKENTNLSPNVAAKLLTRVCSTLPDLLTDNEVPLVEVFTLLSAFAAQMYLQPSSSSCLPDQCATNLRGLLIHGLRESAKEDVRDACFESAYYLLFAFEPKWTIETDSEHTCASDSPKDNPTGIGNFAALLIAVTCGEFRILCDEFVCILESYLPNDSGDPKIDKIRCNRITRIQRLCFCIFDAILGLLVNDSDNEPLWASLPARVIIGIRQELNNTLDLYFEVLKESFKCYKEASIGRDSIHSSVIPFLLRGLSSFSMWMSEDDTLYEPFICNISTVLSFSHLVSQCPCACECELSQPNRPCHRCELVLECIGYSRRSSEAEFGDVFVSCLPVLLSIAELGVTSKPFSKLVFSCSNTLLKLAFAMAICLSNVVQGDHVEVLNEYQIDIGRARTFCYMCIHIMSAVVKVKSRELVNKKKSRKESNEYSDEMLVEFYGIPSMSELGRLVRSLSACRREGGYKCFTDDATESESIAILAKDSSVFLGELESIFSVGFLSHYNN